MTPRGRFPERRNVAGPDALDLRGPAADDANFGFFDHVPELDWDDAFAECAPQGREAKDAFAYYRLLQRFLALLKGRHTRVELPREPRLAGFVDVPLVWLEAVGRRALVADVEAENRGDPGLARHMGAGSGARGHH